LKGDREVSDAFRQVTKTKTRIGKRHGAIGAEMRLGII